MRNALNDELGLETGVAEQLVLVAQLGDNILRVAHQQRTLRPAKIAEVATVHAS